MSTNHDIRALKRLQFFIIVVSGIYLLSLQLGILINVYASKNKAVSHGVSEEAAPIPSLIVCTRTEKNVRESVLNKYNLEQLSFHNKHGEVLPQWQNFAWKNVSLKELYDEAVVFPSAELISCQIGENYTCTQPEGPFHTWTNKLRKTYSCSILSTTVKVPYRYSTVLSVKFQEAIKERGLVYERQQPGKASSQYISKHNFDGEEVSISFDIEMYSNPELGSLSYYTVERYNYVSEGEYGCSADSDVVRCEEDCMEQRLMQGNVSCVLPWMTIDGPECDELSKVLSMIQKEGESSIKCDCSYSCLQYHYALTLNSPLTVYDNTFTIETHIENFKGVTSFKEDYLYSFLDLVANCGGCISVFGTFSLLWLIELALEAVLSVSKKKLLAQCMSWVTLTTKYMTYLATIGCVVLFLYQGFQIIDGFINCEITKRVDRIDSEYAPMPSIVICNAYISKDFNYYGLLEEDYHKNIFHRPRKYMLDCKLDDVNCMPDTGPSHSWKTVYLLDKTCDYITMVYSNKSRPSQFSAEFDNTFGGLQFQLLFENNIPHYTSDERFVEFLLSPFHFVNAVYGIERVIYLPPCSENYKQCRETCWENEFVKYDICTPGTMPREVKNQPCKDLLQYIDLLMYATQNTTENVPGCNCAEACEASEFLIKAGADVVSHESDNAKLSIGLLPLSYTKVTDEWTQTLNNIVAEIGGLLGLLTGASFLQIGLAIIAWLAKLGEKFSSKVYIASFIGNTALHLTAIGFFLHRVYISFEYYAESPVRANEQVLFNSLLAIPDFTMCTAIDRFFYDGMNRLYVLEPPYALGKKQVTSDIEKFWDKYDYTPRNMMTGCTIFGTDCHDEEGIFHKWKTVTNANKYCARLEIQPVRMDKIITNELRFSFSTDVMVYISSRGEESLTHVQDLLGDFELIPKDQKRFYNLHGTVFELLEDKPGNCNATKGYTRIKCWSECLSNYIVNHFGCYYPWMDEVEGLDLCRYAAQYSYKPLLEPIILETCNCSLACNYKDHRLSQLTIRKDDLANSMSIIKVQNQVQVVYETWAYPMSKFLAELGGFLSLFTGLTLYDLLFSSDSIAAKIVRFARKCCKK